jgi:hypothetical protein
MDNIADDPWCAVIMFAQSSLRSRSRNHRHCIEAHETQAASHMHVGSRCIGVIE